MLIAAHHNTPNKVVPESLLCTFARNAESIDTRGGAEVVLSSSRYPLEKMLCSCSSACSYSRLSELSSISSRRVFRRWLLVVFVVATPRVRCWQSLCVVRL
jgi:hypothetical protein